MIGVVNILLFILCSFDFVFIEIVAIDCVIIDGSDEIFDFGLVNFIVAFSFDFLEFIDNIIFVLIEFGNYFKIVFLLSLDLDVEFRYIFLEGQTICHQFL